MIAAAGIILGNGLPDKAEAKVAAECGFKGNLDDLLEKGPDEDGVPSWILVHEKLVPSVVRWEGFEPREDEVSWEGCPEPTAIPSLRLVGTYKGLKVYASRHQDPTRLMVGYEMDFVGAPSYAKCEQVPEQAQA